MALGDYSPTAWVNGTAPAISASNLLNIENKVDELDNYAGNDRGVLSLTITTANVTLSAAQALNDVIICSGTLTGNRSVIIPSGIKKPYKIVIKNINKYYIRFITASSGLYFDAYGLTTDEAAIRPSYSFDIATDGTDVYGEGVPPLVRAEYRRATSQSLASGVATRLNLDSKIVDTHSIVTTGASWAVVIPISGVYVFRIGLLITSASWSPGTQAELGLVVNTDSYYTLDRVDGAAYFGDMHLKGNISLNLKAGDVAYFYVYSAINSQLRGDSGYNFVDIDRIGS